LRFTTATSGWAERLRSNKALASGDSGFGNLNWTIFESCGMSSEPFDKGDELKVCVDCVTSLEQRPWPLKRREQKLGRKVPRDECGRSVRACM
jgi:hypothetical protein